MPIALEIGGEIKRSGFDRGIGCFPIYESLEIAGEGTRITPPVEEASTCTSSGSSSIGKNSESFGSDGEDLVGEEEAESKFKGPLSALESLEEALPMRHGISSFYNGKSKSFASLSDVMISCASVKDLGKQENAYTRKRRNLLASRHFCLKSSSGLLKSNGGGISKKSPSNGRSMLALAVALSNSNSSQDDREQQQYRLIPPLHPSAKNLAVGSPPVRPSSLQCCSLPIRSFSTADLHGMAGSGSSIGFKGTNKRFH